MDISALAKEYKKRVENELLTNILPFWIKYTINTENGGFYGEVSSNLEPVKDAPVSCILASRILWTYSAAARLYGKQEYLKMAKWAYDYFKDRFWDKEYAGVYWMLDARGEPVESKKQIYGQAFGIYAFSEYYRLTGEEESLKKAVEIYECIEKYSYDTVNKGYIEAYDRYWQPETDMRLSSDLMNESKSLNTNMHVMEAYANLMRVWNDPGLKMKQTELIRVIVEKIIDPVTGHARQYFDDNWNVKSDHYLYGHDIEGGWLMVDAALTLGAPDFAEEIKALAARIARVTLDEAVDEDGGLIYEANPRGLVDQDKHWWPQAEACVGFLDAYEITGEQLFFDAFMRTWNFIEKWIAVGDGGEWHRSLTRDLKVKAEPRAGAWKCPYHNSRACYEVVQRLERIAGRWTGGHKNDT